MSTEATTMAGLLASAGAARLGALTVASMPGATSPHPGSGKHLFSTWSQGAIVTPTTYVVFDRKNRPTRPLSELSP